MPTYGAAAAAVREHYETISCGFAFPESLRSEGRAARGTRAAPGPHSFSDRALYSERGLRVTGGLAQATAFCNGRLLQPTGRRADPPISDRYGPGSVAMAARRRNPKGKLTAAHDLRADFGLANILSLLDALPPPRERHLAGYRLCRSNIARADDDHAHWPSRRNPQRRRSAVSLLPLILTLGQDR